MATQLPDHVRSSLTYHFTSDSSGLEMALTLGNMTVLPDGPYGEGEVPAAIKAYLGDDARPMTKEEVKDYLSREEED